MPRPPVMVDPALSRRPRPGAWAHAQANWDLLLVCVAGYMLTSVGRVHQLFPVLQYLRPGILAGGLALVLYLFDRRDPRRSPHLSLPTTKILIAFLVWMVLSVPGSLWQGNSFDMVFGNFIKTFLMYLVIVAAVRGIGDVERLAAVYLLGATAYAGVIISRFELTGGEGWRLGDLYYYDANDFATFAVTAMPFGLYFLHAGRRPRWRVLGAVALVTLALAFVWTGSRGGFVALLAVTAFVVLRYTGIPLRWRLSATALVGLVVLATASDKYWQQMGTIVADADYNRTEESGRLQIWARGLGYMLEHPLLGVGPDNFSSAEGMLSSMAARQQFGLGVRWHAAHNSFLQVGAELGIPGLILFVAFVTSAFRALGQARRSEDMEARPGANPGQLSQALTASMIGFVVGAFFLSLAYSAMLYTLVGLAAGLEKVTRAGRVAGGDARPVQTLPAGRLAASSTYRSRPVRGSFARIGPR